MLGDEDRMDIEDLSASQLAAYVLTAHSVGDLDCLPVDLQTAVQEVCRFLQMAVNTRLVVDTPYGPVLDVDLVMVALVTRLDTGGPGTHDVLTIHSPKGPVRIETVAKV